MRTYYKLTDDGFKALNHMLGFFTKLIESISPFMEIDVSLQDDRYLYCPNCMNKIDIMDETVNMAWAAAKMIEFFKHESCGKCVPCREGCYWMNTLLRRIMAGEAVESDIDLLESVAQNIQGATLCALGEFAINPVLATIQHFREDYLEYIQEKEAVARD